MLLMMLALGALLVFAKGSAIARSYTRSSNDCPRMRILGISAFYHDSAAALMRHGDLIAAGQE